MGGGGSKAGAVVDLTETKRPRFDKGKLVFDGDGVMVREDDGQPMLRNYIEYNDAHEEIPYGERVPESDMTRRNHAQNMARRVIKAADTKIRQGWIALPAPLKDTEIRELGDILTPLGIRFYVQANPARILFNVPDSYGLRPLSPYTEDDEKVKPFAITSLSRYQEGAALSREFAPAKVLWTRSSAGLFVLPGPVRKGGFVDPQPVVDPSGIVVYPVSRTDTIVWQIEPRDATTENFLRGRYDSRSSARTHRIRYIGKEWDDRIRGLDRLADEGKDRQAAEAARRLLLDVIAEVPNNPKAGLIVAWLRYYQQRGQMMTYPNVPERVDLLEQGPDDAWDAMDQLEKSYMRDEDASDIFPERAENINGKWLHPYWTVRRRPTVPWFDPNHPEDREEPVETSDTGVLNAFANQMVYTRKLFVLLYARGDPSKFMAVFAKTGLENRTEAIRRLREFIGLIPDRARRVYMTNDRRIVHGLVPREVEDSLLPVSDYQRNRDRLPRVPVVRRSPQDPSIGGCMLFSGLGYICARAMTSPKDQPVDYIQTAVNVSLVADEQSMVREMMRSFATASPSRRVVYVALRRTSMHVCLHVVSPPQLDEAEKSSRKLDSLYGPPFLSTMPWNRKI